MPNWCYNIATLSHKDPAQIKRVVDAFDRDSLFAEFVPVPEALMDTRTTSHGGSDAAEKDALRADNREQYGYASWYDFRIAKWGTKWDVGAGDGVCDQQNNKTVTLHFDSAWSPPVEWYEKMHRDFGFSITAYYNEPGLVFCGKWENGEDESYEYDECTSENVKDLIGEEIDNVLCISDAMAEWEEMEKELE